MRTRKPLNPMEDDLLGESWTFWIKTGPGRPCHTSFPAVFDLHLALEGLRRKAGHPRVTLPEYARVCQIKPEYARVCQSMPMYARVCKSMPEYARECHCMPEYARVCQSMLEYARVCQSMPEYSRVCQSLAKFCLYIALYSLYMTHSQMLGKIEYTLPAKF